MVVPFPFACTLKRLCQHRQPRQGMLDNYGYCQICYCNTVQAFPKFDCGFDLSVNSRRSQFLVDTPLTLWNSNVTTKTHFSFV